MDKWPSPVFGSVKEKKFAATVVYLDDEGQIYLQTEEQVSQLPMLRREQRWEIS